MAASKPNQLSPPPPQQPQQQQRLRPIPGHPGLYFRPRVQFRPATRQEIQVSVLMISITFITLYLFLGAPLGLPRIFADASSVGVPLSGTKWQSDYAPGTTKFHFAADDAAGDFLEKVRAAPLYTNMIYEGHDGLLDRNSSTIRIRDGLLHSIDEHQVDSEFVSGVNKHLSPMVGFNVDITAPQIIAAAVGLVVVAGLLCALIPGCLALVATNMGNAVTAFRVASGGAVVGNAAGVITALSTAVSSAARRDALDFDTSRPGMLGIDGYYISTELHDHMHRTLSKREDYEDESFSCIYNDGWVGTCYNGNVLKPVLDAVANHDKNSKDRWSCWESRDSNDGTLFGWYYHCTKKDGECGLPCSHGAPLPPYKCATLNDKGGKAFHNC